ncbi:RNA-directed DNA polymerase, eukaryota, partial [Tanacetum coccineum]
IVHNLSLVPRANILWSTLCGGIIYRARRYNEVTDYLDFNPVSKTLNHFAHGRQEVIPYSHTMDLAQFIERIQRRCGNVEVTMNHNFFYVNVNDGSHIEVGDREVDQDFIILRFDYTILHANWFVSFARFYCLVQPLEELMELPEFHTYEPLKEFTKAINLAFPYPYFVVEINKRERHGNDTVYHALFNGSQEKRVSPEHILPYLGCHCYDQRVYDVFDKYIMALSSYSWAEVGLKKKICIIRQVALGLRRLHAKNMVHGDLSPNNIVASRRKIKLKGITCQGTMLDDMQNLARLFIYIVSGGRHAFNQITEMNPGNLTKLISNAVMQP